MLKFQVFRTCLFEKIYKTHGENISYWQYSYAHSQIFVKAFFSFKTLRGNYVLKVIRANIYIILYFCILCCLTVYVIALYKYIYIECVLQLFCIHFIHFIEPKINSFVNNLFPLLWQMRWYVCYAHICMCGSINYRAVSAAFTYSIVFRFYLISTVAFSLFIAFVTWVYTLFCDLDLWTSHSRCSIFIFVTANVVYIVVVVVLLLLLHYYGFIIVA